MMAALITLVAILIIGIGFGFTWYRSRLTETSNSRVVQPKKKELDPVDLTLTPTLPPHYLAGEPSGVFSDTLQKMGQSLTNYEELKEQREKLLALAQDASRPLMVVIMGEFNTGKSTFINTLLKEELLATDVIPATAAITMLSYGEQEEVIAHYHDGSNERFEYDQLAALSAEGDPFGEKIRGKLSYLEIRMPHPILKKLTIVDTPGLNADHPLHTKVTEEFMNRSDLVLWLFAYGNVGTKTEVSSLQKLDIAQKPIGIITQIDENDPEEEDLVENLQRSERRLDTYVDRVIGVSAILAQEARIHNDEEMWQESGWSQIEQLIESEISSQSGSKKTVRVLMKLQEILQELDTVLASYKDKYEAAHQRLYRYNEYVDDLQKRRRELANFVEIFSEYDESNALAAMAEVKDIPEYVQDAESLNQYKNTLDGVLDSLVDEQKAIQRNFDTNARKIEQHNNNFKRLEKDYEEYNNSGLLGGRPLFDWNGDLQELQQREKRMTQEANQLNEEKERILMKDEARVARWVRADEEAFELIQDILESLQLTLNQHDEELNNTDGSREKAEEELNELHWLQYTDHLYSELYWNLDLTVTALERNLGLSKGTLLQDRTKIDESIAKLIEFTSAEMESTLNEAAVSVELPSEEVILGDLNDKLEEDTDIVELDPGTYRVEDTIHIHHSIKIKGSEYGETKIVSKTATPLMTFSGDSRVELDGITFEYTGNDITNVVNVSSSSFLIKYCQFIGGKIDDETISFYLSGEVEEDSEDDPDHGMGLAIRGSAKGIVQQCQFHGNTQGIFVNEKANVEIYTSSFYQNTLGGITFADHSHGVVEQNEFVDSLIGIGVDQEAAVTLSQNRLWGNKLAIGSLRNSNLSVDSNEIVGNYGGAMAVGDSSKATVYGNYLAYNGPQVVGILQRGQAYTILRFNRITNHMVGVGATDNGHIELHGNLTEKSYQGMAFEGEVAGAVSDNEIRNNAAQGIMMGGNVDFKVEDNQVHENGMGIRVIEQAKVMVNRNHLKNHIQGISFGNDTELSVSDNCLEGNEVGVFSWENAVSAVTGNTCSNNDIGMVYDDQASGTATKNSFSENKTAGIVLYDQSIPTIKDNEILSNQGQGIQIHHTAAPTIEENKIMDNESSGVIYLGNSRGQLAANAIFNNKGWGIQVLSNNFSTNWRQNSLKDNQLGNIDQS